ncbi:MAG: hypothetical protein A3H57_00945 [Candidatus Taylorbacteria bacterium RIFCSPLOWO2_02_FULL_43_11]|uniref:Oxidized purine nucleoside triphosphate hydrolase n=1 Tax=Candidatus Taylorbacteria bacterium RIFCSPHIGHO2_02_FULL_43_32b TaxID=1802306 RepID=A0A1G2MLB9_9BACT|nr:MAG: hypothetical protein A2743_03985 [Candidatus Taylorbacteria bacterium RIFCSPHIGHO2_01_FULL_43_47]OHA23999.1 MAG: hypothetical protein A3C72_02545 [Candidatus Taylorbacteria bacterium RIFCSPHIGHO2_02_FULL_43_32b]OHA31017.1 MAG: hypothetical protein A3B08_03055 [Candidatus Taylorbacteria bacterium RIFCSPLOWO2_01_FULL_43_44]OHA37700.1 MAG: hypothetical protein A3H57_00945 [Candidatus Taylorbacteria bacterium RIFCSPLOWO2_02_FULL_43_11]
MEKKDTKKVLHTLVIIHDHPRVLLGMKKRGFGQGRWNGFGGKLENGESIEEAAKRETFEEAGIRISDMDKIGILDFEFDGKEEGLEVHLFKAKSFYGNPIESEEMSPRWFFMEEIPFAMMWPDDRYWFPFFIRNKKFRAKFKFGEGDKIIGYDLNEVKNL